MASLAQEFFGVAVGSGPYAGKPHTGIDLPAKDGTPVYAATTGKVTRVDSKDPGGGLIVEVTDATGRIVTQYAHLSAADVKVGQAVAQGQQIAAVGHSGAATGAHLHFGVKVDGKWRNPLDYLPGIEGTPLGAYSVNATLASTSNDPSIANPGWWNSFSSDVNAFAKDHPGATWRDFAMNRFGDFHFVPAWTSTDILKATDALGISDKPVSTADATRVAAKALNLGAGGNPLSALGDWASGLAAVLGFLLDPLNWLRLIMLLVGFILAFVGGRMVYQAT